MLPSGHRLEALLIFCLFWSFQVSNSADDQDEYCQQNNRPLFDSLAIFIIDAMRIDFVPTIENPQAKPKWKFLENLAKTNGIGVRILTETPTVTVPRTKAILTGLNPSFMDVLFNLNSDRIYEDNLVQQFYKSERFRKLYFYGDHTWENFFPRSEHYFENDMLTSSVNLYDLNGDDTRIANAIKRDLNNHKEWNVLITHWPGIDRIGHTKGVNWRLLNDKLLFFDQIAERIFDHWNKNNISGLFVLSSDHGMHRNGGHGSGEYDEVNTPLLMISNRQIVEHISVKTPFDQIDIAVTISQLFGIDIPNKSQGKLITDALRTFGMDPHRILCSQKRNVEALHRSFEYEAKLLDDKFYQAHYQPELAEARRLYQEFLKDPSKADQASRAYDKYLNDIQGAYSTRERYGMLTQILFIIGFSVFFIFALLMLYYDFINYSILFYRVDPELKNFHNKKYDTNQTSTLLLMENQEFDENNDKDLIIVRGNRNWFESKTIKILALVPFIVRFASLGSKAFIDSEVVFWNYSGEFYILLISFFNLLNILYRINTNKLSIIYSIAVYSIHHYFMIKYKTMIPINFWERSFQTNSMEEYFTKSNNSHTFHGFDTFVFVCVLSFLIIQMRFHVSNRFVSNMFVFWYFCIFLFRHDSNAVTAIYGLKFLPLNPNLYAQTLYFTTLLLTLMIFLPKIPKSNKFIALKKSGKLAYFQQIWILLCAIVLEPKFLPLFSAHILTEICLNQMFISSSFTDSSDTSFNEFIRFLTYLSFAYSSFYQFGNSNSISTLNVTACFTGFKEFIVIPCVALTIISIYSGFIFWIVSLFYRLNTHFNLIVSSQNDASPHRSKVSKNFKNKEKEVIFRSVVRLGLAWSIGVFGMMTVVTFVLLNHLLIWTTILPKYLYELSFTVICLIGWCVLWCSLRCFRKSPNFS